jgi:hypothetical protein
MKELPQQRGVYNRHGVEHTGSYLLAELSLRLRATPFVAG